jgi:acetolactate synthase-1/3 small subunit
MHSEHAISPGESGNRLAAVISQSIPRRLAALNRGLDEEFFMRHVLSALVQNQPGVLAHVSGMLASRGFNIDSLAVGETEMPHLARMTFTVNGDDNVLDQVRKQLDKIISIVRVDDISSENFVERDLMLIKVVAPPEKRTEIALLVEMFRGRVVDISLDDMMIEISGQEGKVEKFIDLMRPYGIVELARTGRIALVRGRMKNGGAA